MSAPFNEFIPLAVFVSSLLGSLHCVGMCGGLVAASTRNLRDQWAYHLSRLSGYLLLGLAAGFLGEKVLGTTGLPLPFAWIGAVILSGGLIFLGIRLWTRQSLHFSVIPNSLLQRFFSLSGGKPAATGFLSILLPCGWLHAYVIAAAATAHPISGTLTLLFFWAGTLPALILAPSVFQKFLKPLTLRAPRLAASVLILTGLINVAWKMYPTWQSEQSSTSGPACHDVQATSSQKHSHH